VVDQLAGAESFGGIHSFLAQGAHLRVCRLCTYVFV